MSKKEKNSFFSILFSVREFKRIFSMNSDMIKKTLKEKEKENITESFDEAMYRLNLTDEILEQKYDTFRKISIISFIFLALLILILIYVSFKQTALMNMIILSIFSFYFLVNGLKFSFHCYQIKNRKLKSLKEFILKPKSWIVINKK